MSYNYNDISEVFEILNHNKIEYLVMRNFENLLSPDIYLDGHGDIDILCSNSLVVADLLKAEAWNPQKERDRVHYRIYVHDAPVSLDLRSVGDGYYCTEWQEYILKHRISNGTFFIMDNVSYFYTLIYHAILQKREFSQEYQERLEDMAFKLGVSINSYDLHSFITCLNAYMQKHDFRYTYPTDIYVPLQTKYVDKKLLERNIRLAFQHWLFDTKISIIEFLVSVKHKLKL